MAIHTVSESALFHRIDRRLKREGGSLHRESPRSRGFQTLGRFYTMEAGNIKHYGLDSACLERMGREMGVLGAHERVES